MPFKDRDGNDFFIKVQAYKGLEKEVNSPYLAMCPVCAAFYIEHFRWNTGKEEFKKYFEGAVEDGNLFLIDLSPENRGKNVLKFCKKHFVDLETLLEFKYTDENSEFDSESKP